jgi:hypothetical protein
MKELINSKYRFSLYKDLFSVENPTNIIDVNQVFEIIKYGYLRKEIRAIRTASTPEEAKKLKLSILPCITLSGIFSHRDKNSLVKHSGLLQIDIDHVENYSAIFQKICKDNFTYVCFRSPRGKGVKVIFKINPSSDTHLSQFLAIEKYFKERYNVEIDSSCKDLARPMLLSYDPDIYCNPYSYEFKNKVELKEQKIKEQQSSNKKILISTTQKTKDDVEKIIQMLEAKRIDITSPYENWIRIGYSLANEFGEQGRDYFIRVSSMHQKFDISNCHKQYDKLLANSDHSNSIGTFFYFAKECGIELKN